MYLSGDLLLREDPEESLQMVEKVMKVFSIFKENYQALRERLANQVKHAPWDFPSDMIFSCFNGFFNRMLQLKVRSCFCFSYSSESPGYCTSCCLTNCNKCKVAHFTVCLV